MKKDNTPDFVFKHIKTGHIFSREPLIYNEKLRVYLPVFYSNYYGGDKYRYFELIDNPDFVLVQN